MNNNFIRNNVPDFMTVSQDDITQALKKCVDIDDFYSLISVVIQKKNETLNKRNFQDRKLYFNKWNF